MKSLATGPPSDSEIIAGINASPEITSNEGDVIVTAPRITDVTAPSAPVCITILGITTVFLNTDIILAVPIIPDNAANV